MVTCKHCQREVKLNQIIRSATHDLGCVHCYGNPEAVTPDDARFASRQAVALIEEAETIAARFW